MFPQCLLASAYANLPNHLKEKLEGRIENRGRFQNLYQCSQMISTTNALKMFHETIQHTETKKEPAEESNSHLLINSAERSRLNQLDGHFKELISLLDDSGVVKVKIDPGLETSGWTSWHAKPVDKIQYVVVCNYLITVLSSCLTLLLKICWACVPEYLFAIILPSICYLVNIQIQLTVVICNFV